MEPEHWFLTERYHHRKPNETYEGPLSTPSCSGIMVYNRSVRTCTAGGVSRLPWGIRGVMLSSFLLFCAVHVYLSPQPNGAVIHVNTASVDFASWLGRSVPQALAGVASDVSLGNKSLHAGAAGEEGPSTSHRKFPATAEAAEQQGEEDDSGDSPARNEEQPSTSQSQQVAMIRPTVTGTRSESSLRRRIRRKPVPPLPVATLAVERDTIEERRVPENPAEPRRTTVVDKQPQQSLQHSHPPAPTRRGQSDPVIFTTHDNPSKCPLDVLIEDKSPLSVHCTIDSVTTSTPSSSDTMTGPDVPSDCADKHENREGGPPTSHRGKEEKEEGHHESTVITGGQWSTRADPYAGEGAGEANRRRRRNYNIWLPEGLALRRHTDGSRTRIHPYETSHRGILLDWDALPSSVDVSVSSQRNITHVMQPCTSGRTAESSAKISAPPTSRGAHMQYFGDVDSMQARSSNHRGAETAFHSGNDSSENQELSGGLQEPGAATPFLPPPAGARTLRALVSCLRRIANSLERLAAVQKTILRRAPKAYATLICMNLGVLTSEVLEVKMLVQGLIKPRARRRRCANTATTTRTTVHHEADGSQVAPHSSHSICSDLGISPRMPLESHTGSQTGSGFASRLNPSFPQPILQPSSAILTSLVPAPSDEPSPRVDHSGQPSFVPAAATSGGMAHQRDGRSHVPLSGAILHPSHIGSSGARRSTHVWRTGFPRAEGSSVLLPEHLTDAASFEPSWNSQNTAATSQRTGGATGLQFEPLPCQAAYPTSRGEAPVGTVPVKSASCYKWSITGPSLPSSSTSSMHQQSSTLNNPSGFCGDVPDSRRTFRPIVLDSNALRVTSVRPTPLHACERPTFVDTASNSTVPDPTEPLRHVTDTESDAGETTNAAVSVKPQIPLLAKRRLNFDNPSSAEPGFFLQQIVETLAERCSDSIMLQSEEPNTEQRVRRKQNGQ